MREWNECPLRKNHPQLHFTNCMTQGDDETACDALLEVVPGRDYKCDPSRLPKTRKQKKEQKRNEAKKRKEDVSE